MHSFRRSYATHLIEAGFDPLFVQEGTARTPTHVNDRNLGVRERRFPTHHAARRPGQQHRRSPCPNPEPRMKRDVDYQWGWPS